MSTAQLAGTSRSHAAAAAAFVASPPPPTRQIFATSQGSRVTLWRPLPANFTPPVGIDAARYRNSLIPILTLEVGFEVYTMSFAPNFDCLSILGSAHVNSHPYQQYFPHPICDADLLSRFQSDKNHFRLIDIDALLENAHSEQLPYDTSFAFSSFLSTKSAPVLAFWGKGGELYHLSLKDEPQLVKHYRFGADVKVVSLDVSCDESNRNSTSITACPSDPNKFAVSFTTGEVGIFALIPSCGVKMLALLPAFEGHPGASKSTFSVHDERLAWVNSLGQLLTNDLKSTKVKPFPTRFPLSSSAYHPTCRALISTTPEGGLPIPICAAASWADPFINQGVFSVSDGQPTPTVNPPQLASPLRSPCRKTSDVEPSFIECFSPVKCHHVVPKDNRPTFEVDELSMMDAEPNSYFKEGSFEVEEPSVV
ncbi:hypothetical protein L0F63_006094 [Massospora cicadina]|nr:hypothetical protein L0F63_006094 [Massospora cicadina]